MCEPTLALMAISTAFGAYQQYNQGRQQAAAARMAAANNQRIAEYNAQVAEVNAEMNKRAADDAITRGANDAATIRENARKANARGRAIMGGSGLLTDTGSNLDLLLDNTEAGEINALTVFNNAEREAYGFKVAATNNMAQAAGSRLEGSIGVQNANYQANIMKQNGLISAGSTLVTGATNFGLAGGFDKKTWQKGK